MWRNVREKRRLARFRNGPANQIGSQCVIERLSIDISLASCGSYACHTSYFEQHFLHISRMGQSPGVTALTLENAQNHRRSCLHKNLTFLPESLRPRRPSTTSLCPCAPRNVIG